MVTNKDEKPTQPGPTGNFPEGQLNEHDEGELAIAIKADPDTKKVLLDFGTPVAWLALDAQHAINLAAVLIEKATEATRGNIVIVRKGL